MLMRLDFHLLVIFLTTEYFMGSNAFIICSFPRLRAQATTKAIHFLSRRLSYTLHNPCASKFFLDSFLPAKRCLSQVNNNGLGATSAGIGDGQIVHHDNNDNARKYRKEKLHYHLNELGVDADSLEDASFRSVTTTGNNALTLHF